MRRGLTVSAAVGLITGVTLMFGGLASASVNYCVGDYVVPGGVNNASAVGPAFTHPRVAHVYKYFGINKQDINNLGTQSVAGTVTKSGNVKVNGKIVATDAISAGCGFIPGSTKVNDGYMTFYTRPTSVSFASRSLKAMVVMKNGRFDFAILNGCGNPVKATPVKPKKPAVTTTATPTQSQTQTQTQTVVVNNTPPEVEAAQTTAPAKATALPNTGPGDVLGISGLATVIGSAGHYIYNRRRRY